jgi:hypothetical protein
MRRRVASTALCCGLAVSLLTAASAPGRPAPPRLLADADRFQVRPAGSHRYREWDKLMRFGGTDDWRVTRYTGNP